jgi:hypothetical protein
MIDEEGGRRERVVEVEVAPASYTSQKRAMVIRVREARSGAKPQTEARFRQIITIGGGVKL